MAMTNEPAKQQLRHEASAQPSFLFAQPQTQADRRRFVSAEHAPTGSLLQHFNAAHVARFGSKASITRGKDATLLTNLWRQRQGDPVGVELLIDAFFQTSDPFVLRSGFTVGVFVSQVGRLIQIAMKALVRPAPDTRLVELLEMAQIKRYDYRWFDGAAVVVDMNKRVVSVAVQPSEAAFVLRNFGVALADAGLRMWPDFTIKVVGRREPV